MASFFAAGKIRLGPMAHDGLDRFFGRHIGLPSAPDHRPHRRGEMGADQGIHLGRGVLHGVDVDLLLLVGLPNRQYTFGRLSASGRRLRDSRDHRLSKWYSHSRHFQGNIYDYMNSNYLSTASISCITRFLG